MTKHELLEVAKPILFNTDMVRAIIEGKKTVTRRVIKPQPENVLKVIGIDSITDNFKTVNFLCKSDDKSRDYILGCKMPYIPGDILYVRETWQVQSAHRYDACAKIDYKAGLKNGELTKIYFPNGCTDSCNRDDYDEFIEKWGYRRGWIPSIHMPQKVARIFLRVTDVRVEKLQDITEIQACNEGADFTKPTFCENLCCDDCESNGECQAYVHEFKSLWNSTLQKSDLDRYGWNANPWVWVIEFDVVINKEKP